VKNTLLLIFISLFVSSFSQNNNDDNIKKFQNEKIGLENKLDSLKIVNNQKILVYKSKLQEISDKKNKLDIELNTQKLMELSKEKHLYTDSIKILNSEYIIIENKIDLLTYKIANLKNQTTKRNNNSSTNIKSLKEKTSSTKKPKQDKIKKNTDKKKNSKVNKDKETKTKKETKHKKIIEKNKTKADIVIYDNNIDTSKLTKKQREKFKKKLDLEFENDTSITMTQKIDAVIKKSNKKKKYSFGEEVDYNRREKARFFLLRAQKEIEKGNISKADDFVDKSLKLNPSYEEAYIMKGDIYASLKFYDRAVRHYYHASILKPNKAQTFYNIGNCFMQTGKDKNAIKEWTKAIEIDDNYILAYVGRASIYQKNKKYKKAIQDYNKIFAINKYFYVAHRARGIAYLELGNYEKAIIDFNKYLEYESKDAFVYFKRGMAKLSDNEIYGGCTDLLTSAEMGNKQATKALKKHCEK